MCKKLNKISIKNCGTTQKIQRKIRKNITFKYNIYFNFEKKNYRNILKNFVETLKIFEKIFKKTE